MKTRIRSLLAVGFGLALWACAGSTPSVPPTTPPSERPDGQSEFLTPSQGQNALSGGGRETASDGATTGAPAAGATPSPNAPTAQTPSAPREIEESDIYKLDGNHLFVLNRYRGLQIIDIADLDHPRVIGHAPIFGYPKEMYVRGTNAYVIVSDYYTFWRDTTAAADAAPNGFYGSQVRVIDITDRTHPRVAGGINLAGDCSDSRIVGDVMYLVSTRYGYWSRYDSTDNVDKTQILSLAIADPANVHVVDSKDFPRNGWEHHINVTPNTIYLASSGYVGGTWPNAYETRIKYIDISNPLGQIRVRGEAGVPGMVRDRWSLDEFEGVLRVASGTAWGNGDVFLTTFSVANPDALAQLGQYTMHVNENLTSARFDGNRGYLVTYRNVDPLWIFDLSNPAQPRIKGELHMTGWLDFMVPMGDRIVALGHEDTTDANGQRNIALAVSLIDVADQRDPALLSRVALDGVWGWVPGDRDDFAKVFKVIGEQNLVVFPFQAWSRTDYRYIGGVQLIDVFRDNLVRRGLIQNAGWVERGIPYGENTVLTLSSEIFQILDITNRDSPRLRGRLELARNVQDFALVGDYTVQLSGDWYSGDTNVVVTPKSDPDTPTPVSALHVPAPYGRLFMNGNFAYVASLRETTATNGTTSRATQVQVVDLSNPLVPRLRGTVTLPEEVWLGYRYWYWGSGDEVVQVGSTLAFHRFQYPYYYGGGDCFDCPSGTGTVTRPTHKVYLVDLANVDAPRLASTVDLSTPDWSWGLRASGTNLYLSEYRSVQTNSRWYVRYAVRKIDIANPASPVVGTPINIPGVFVDASADGQYLYTLENYWDSTASSDQYYGQNRTLFHTLALVGNRAYLRSSVRLEGYVNNVVIKNGVGYTSTQRYVPYVTAQGQTSSQSVTSLLTLDLSNPRATTVAGRADIPYDYAYLQKVEGGRAFLGSGAGIFSYLVVDPAHPRYEDFFRTQGWAQDIIVSGAQAFVPSGYYGVQVLALGQRTN